MATEAVPGTESRPANEIPASIVAKPFAQAIRETTKALTDALTAEGNARASATAAGHEVDDAEIALKTAVAAADTARVDVSTKATATTQVMREMAVMLTREADRREAPIPDA